MKAFHKLAYMLIGGVVAVILTTTMQTSARNETVNASVYYRNIKVNINGAEVTLTDLEGNIQEPVLLFDTVYVPLSATARAFGYTSAWDGGNFTVNLSGGGSSPNTVSTPSQQAAVFTLVVPPYQISNASWIKLESNVLMGGKDYQNAISYGTEGHTMHNLEGKYTKLTGYIGHIDGQSNNKATFYFYGDNKLLASYDLAAEDLPKQVSIDVSGVTQLKIEKKGGTITAYAFAEATIE